MPTLKGSWRTAATGIAGGAVILVMQVFNAIDNDPATVIDRDAVAMAVTVIVMGWLARDNKVRSESVGAK